MRSTALAAISLLWACSPSMQSGAGDSVTLRVEPTTTSAGDSVTLILANGTAGSVGYNLCSSGLEQEMAGAWQTVPVDRVCTMELRSLVAGEEARYSIDLPDDLAAGRYRYLTNVDTTDTAASGAIRSTPFQVR